MLPIKILKSTQFPDGGAVAGGRMGRWASRDGLIRANVWPKRVTAAASVRVSRLRNPSRPL